MSEQSLNINYDTNYTTIINDWGFVDNKFSEQKWKKPWFFDLLFWNPDKLMGNDKWASWEKADEKKADAAQTQAPAQDNKGSQQAQQPADQQQNNTQNNTQNKFSDEKIN